MLRDRDFSAPSDAVADLRDLARDGRLVAEMATAPPVRRTALLGATYAVAWPVVYARLTRSVELHRGHPACASSVERMADDCLDRFEDDVEAVVEDVVAHATKPIRNLEAWIASRLNAATVDAHRRQRGNRGALQRPRLPKWLAAGLDHDPWLCELAIQLLTWVGVPTTAGTGLWPLDSWAQRRAEVTGDWTGSDPPAVSREVDRVLAVMRGHDCWYNDYVERPLGRKRAPLAGPPAGREEHREPASLSLVDTHQAEDAWLTGVALEAVDAISRRLGRGDDAREVVTDVIRTMFGDDPDHDLDQVPHHGSRYEERVSRLLRDPWELDRIIDDVLSIVDPPRAGGMVGCA